MRELKRPSARVMHLGVKRLAGFTLLELLIVLSIMAAIAIMAWPRIMPALSRSVPRTAALQLKRDLAEAREEAIRTGETWVFRYQVDSPLYQIAPASWQEQNQPDNQPERGQYEARELPGDVVFIEPGPPWEEGMELRTEEELRKEEGELLVAEDAQLTLTPDAPLVEQVPWITGSEFFADGRARDCELELHPRDSNHFIRVRLRGFTGALALGPVERKSEFQAKSADGTAEIPSDSGQEATITPSHSEPSPNVPGGSPRQESYGKS